MFCSNCGFNAPDDAEFCIKCGSVLGNTIKPVRMETDSYTEYEDNTSEFGNKTLKNEYNHDNTEEKQLAKIVEELRAENKQAVTKRGWYIYSLMSAIPIVGFIFFATKKKDKNENKKNFAKAGFVVNLILSIIVFMSVSACIFYFLGSRVNFRCSKNEAVNETTVVETGNSTENSTQKVQSTTCTTATGSVKRTELTKNYSYDKSSKSLKFELNGNTFTYPISSNEIKDLGYLYVSNTLSSETTALDMYMDTYKSTVMIKYNAKAGNTSSCYALAMELKEGSTFMGLSSKSDYAEVKEVFKTADMEIASDYRSDTGTGIIQYMFGDRRISIAFDRGYVSGVTIE